MIFLDIHWEYWLSTLQDSTYIKTEGNDIMGLYFFQTILLYYDKGF